MSRIAVAHTTPTAESSTRADILNRFLRESRLGLYFTASSGGTTSAVGTRIKSSQFSPDDHVGGWVYVVADAGGAGAAPEGETSSITAYEPGQGEITFSPPLSAAVASGDTVQIWHGIHPQDVLDTLDEILTEQAFLPCWTFCSEAADADMEQSGTSDWSATNATISKVSTEPALMGKRWLSVATTAAGGYASQTFSVEPGESYHVSALVRASAAGTTPTLTAYDDSNGSAIKTVSTTLRVPIRLWMEFTTPSGCNQMTVRMGNAENGVTSFWDELVVYSLNAAEIRLPWWVKNKNQVKGVFRLVDTEGGRDTWSPEMRGILDDRWDVVEDRGRCRLVSRYGYGISAPVFIFGTRNEFAFANNTVDTVSVDADFINAALCYKVFQHLTALPDAGTLDKAWIDLQYERWRIEYERELRRQAERREQVIQTALPETLIGRRDWTQISRYTVRRGG